MSKNNIDITNIVYANDKTKLTLKSKQVLDKLASQVALWNTEKWRNNFNSPSTTTNTSFNRNCPRTPNNNRLTLSNKDFRSKLMGSVKQKVALFELQKDEVLPLKDLPPKRKVLEVLPNTYIKHTVSKSFIKENSPNNTLNNNENKENNVEDSDVTTHEEEYFPPPPPPSMFTENSHHDLANLSIEELQMSLDENTSQKYESNITNLDTNSIESNDYLTSSLTDISVMDGDNFSLFTEFVRDYNQLKDNDTVNYARAPSPLEYTADSPSTFAQPSRRKIRRSLSFNDKIEVIDPSSDDDLSSINPSGDESMIIESETEADVDEDTQENVEVNTKNISLSTDFDSDMSKLLSEEQTVKRILLRKMGFLKDIIASDERMGNENHTHICQEIIHYKIRLNAISQQIRRGPRKPALIDSEVSVSELKMELRGPMALVDIKELTHVDMYKKWNKIKTIYHVIMFVHCKMDSELFESALFTFISISDARKFNIKYQTCYWVNFQDHLSFCHVQPKSKLKFEVFMMTVNPSNDTRKLKGTPLTKIFRSRCNSADKITRNDYNSDRMVSFMNTASFDLDFHELDNEYVMVNDKINVEQSSIFSGLVNLKARKLLTIAQKFGGRLNVYNGDGKGMGSWSYYNCQLSCDGIHGKADDLRSNIKASSLFVPYNCMVSDDAKMCDFHICAKPNSFCVVIDEEKLQKHQQKPQNVAKPRATPVNKRQSVDGRQKNRFLAEAETFEEANTWCTMINAAKAAYTVFNVRTN